MSTACVGGPLSRPTESEPNALYLRDVQLYRDLLETSSELNFGLLVAPLPQKFALGTFCINQVVVRYWQVLHDTGVAHSHSLSALSSPIQLCIYDYFVLPCETYFYSFGTMTSAVGSFTVVFWWTVDCSLLLQRGWIWLREMWWLLAILLGHNHVHISLVGSRVVNYLGTPL